MFLRSMRTAAAVTAGVAICGVVAIEWIGMFGRYFGLSTPWVAEALNLVTFWLVWPAIVLAQFAGGHYVIDLLGARLPKRARRLRDATLKVVVIGYCALISFYALKSLAGPGQSMSHLSPITRDWEIAAIPVGLLGVMILVARDLFKRRAVSEGDERNIEVQES